MSRAIRRGVAAFLAFALVGCESSTSPGGDAQLTRVCASLIVSPSDMADCTIRVTPLSGGTLTINSVTLLGHAGQPVSAGFGYGNALGLRFYSSPTPPTLAGQSVGPTPFEFLVTAVMSTGEGETTPAPGNYPAAVRVNVTPAGGSATDLEVPVAIVVTS